MARDEIFHSVMRSAGDRAGVFEYDVDTGYFYLYDMTRGEGQKVIAAIRILSGPPDFEEEDVAIRWDSAESTVGLFIHGQLWAAFDGRTGAKYGGNYDTLMQPEIPLEVAAAFK